MANLLIPFAAETDVVEVILGTGEVVFDRTHRVIRVGDGIQPGGHVIASASTMVEIVAGSVGAMVASAQAARDETIAAQDTVVAALGTQAAAIAATNAIVVAALAFG